MDKRETEIREIELTTEELDRVSGGFWFNPYNASTQSQVPYYIGRYAGPHGIL